MTVMDGEGASTGAARTMRSDAQRSERVLVRAGKAAIHREGMHVPLGTIAADAGVGIGALYRHFPTRAAVLASPPTWTGSQPSREMNAPTGCHPIRGSGTINIRGATRCQKDWRLTPGHSKWA